MWLGYYFFYCIHQIFFNHKYNFSIGKFDVYNPSHQKDLFLVLIFANIGFFAASLISSKFIFNKVEYINKKYSFNNFFNKNFIWIIFILVLLFSLTNIYFKLFDYYYFTKPKFSSSLDLILKWFFLFGFSSILCIFLNLNLNKSFVIKIFVISSLQEFLFYFSILSRGCIFNSLALLLALFVKNKKFNYQIKTSYFMMLFFLIVILFLTNFYLLINERAGSNKENYYQYRGELSKIKIIKVSNIESDILKVNNANYSGDLSNNQDIFLSKSENKYFYFFEREKIMRIIFSIKNRIFGVDSLMAIVVSKNKGFKLFRDSLNEKFNPGSPSFFDKLRNQENIDIKISNNLTLPGFIGFLFYTDSLIFVLTVSMIVMLFFNFFEKINILLNNNYFLSALISQLIAYRLWHFGYAPFNSYKFFLAIIFSIIFVYIIQKFLIFFKVIKK